MNENNENNWGMMIFKDTFEYLTSGFLSEHEFCELITCIYQARENGIYTSEKDLSMKTALVWKTLKNNIRISVKNSKYYSKKRKKESIDTSTGEVFVPTDEPMTSDLTIDTLLEDEQDGLKFDENKAIETSNDTNIQKENIVEKKADSGTNTALKEFIMSRPEGMMRCQQWNNFVNLYPDAEKIQKISGITDLSAVKLYNQLKESAFSFGK